MVKNKNAMVVSLNNDVSEIIQLADSLGFVVIKTFVQNRKNPDVNSYIGVGKLNEIKEFIDTNNEIELIIINGEIKPSQWFNLEKNFNVNVYDRIRLILEIFEKRADRKEAKLQVKLAQLHYEKPFVKEAFTTIGEIDNSETISIVQEGLMIPAAIAKGFGELRISMDSTRITSLAESIRYLYRYPYGCLEQRSSAIFPVILFRFDLISPLTFKILPANGKAPSNVAVTFPSKSTI